VEEVAWVELGEALSLGSAEVRTFREGLRFSSRQGGKSFRGRTLEWRERYWKGRKESMVWTVGGTFDGLALVKHRFKEETESEAVNYR
jgi:hypothetical protein